VLHVAPEAAIGGPLALVEDGDLIELDVAARRLDLLVDAAVLEQRRRAPRATPTPVRSGYGDLFVRHVTQADLGCDFDFIRAGIDVPEPVIA